MFKIVHDLLLLWLLLASEKDFCFVIIRDCEIRMLHYIDLQCCIRPKVPHVELIKFQELYKNSY